MKKKILVIEDDEIFANIYRNKLIVDGFEADVAGDAEKGYELLQSYQPDAVLLDLILPKMQGVELIRKIRSEAQYKKLPLVIFTNTYLTSTVQEAWKAGATKCLEKASSTPEDVIATIHNILDDKGDKPAEPSSSLLAANRRVVANEDNQFQAELRKQFVDSLPATIATLRTHYQNLIKSGNEAARAENVHQIYRRIHAMTGSASIVGMTEIARLTDAFEALLKELHEKPKSVNASTLRTIAAAIDLLAVLFEQRARIKEGSTARVLVVEDEAISRRAINYALDKAKLKFTNVEDPLHAYDLLEKNRFDLIFLDVDMPNMSGYELCSKLRTLPDHKSTPVVFVTSLNDFESRANSTMSGGNDFIVKPFLFVELAVKALVYVLRDQVRLPARGKPKVLTRA